DEVEEPVGLGAADRVLVDDMKRIARLLHVQPGDRPPGAADEVKRLAGYRAQHRRLVDDPVYRLADRLFVVAELSEPQWPERQGDAVADRRPAVPGLDLHQLDTAAADIADDAVSGRDPGEDAERRQPRLLGPVDDPHLDAVAPFELGGELGAVLRLAHRGGGDDRQMIDAQRPRQRDKALDVGIGEFDAVAVEPPGAGNAASEAAHDLFVEQRHQRRTHPLEHDEAQRIGADIDHRYAAGG